MYADSLIFAQVMEHLPMHTLRRCVRRYLGHHKVKSFTCLDQFRCMAFAQLTYRESLRDIEACLYTILQVLSVTLFEKIPLNQTLSDSEYTIEIPAHPNQLNLFD